MKVVSTRPSHPRPAARGALATFGSGGLSAIGVVHVLAIFGLLPTGAPPPGRTLKDQPRGVRLNTTDEARYLTDANGQRVRKVVRTGANVQDRRYLDGWESWSKTVSGALVETKTVDAGNTVANPAPVQRYHVGDTATWKLHRLTP